MSIVTIHWSNKIFIFNIFSHIISIFIHVLIIILFNDIKKHFILLISLKIVTFIIFQSIDCGFIIYIMTTSGSLPMTEGNHHESKTNIITSNVLFNL